MRVAFAALVLFALIALQSWAQASDSPPDVRVEVPQQLRVGEETATVLLVNASAEPIYLRWSYPGSVPLLQRRDERSGAWESAEPPGQCGTVARASEPREVAARSSLRVRMWWEGVVVEYDGQWVFLSASGDSLDVNGLFRLSMEYAVEPWTIGREPQQVLHAVSEPFELER